MAIQTRLRETDSGYAGAIIALGQVPIGGVVAWLKSFAGVPALPSGWVECNGQNVSGSLLSSVPNLNASGGGSKRFLRGSTTSGTTGGSDSYTPAGTIGIPSSTINVASTIGSAVASSTHIHTFTGTTDSAHLPSYYEVVWIIRII